MKLKTVKTLLISPLRSGERDSTSSEIVWKKGRLLRRKNTALWRKPACPRTPWGICAAAWIWGCYSWKVCIICFSCHRHARFCHLSSIPKNAILPPATRAQPLSATLNWKESKRRLDYVYPCGDERRIRGSQEKEVRESSGSRVKMMCVHGVAPQAAGSKASNVHNLPAGESDAV